MCGELRAYIPWIQFEDSDAAWKRSKQANFRSRRRERAMRTLAFYMAEMLVNSQLTLSYMLFLTSEGRFPNKPSGDADSIVI